MALVEVDDLVKSYPSHAGPPVRVVDGVSFRIERGRTLGVVGESGSGKSTVARLLLRLIEPDSGAVRLDGHDLMAASGRQMRHFRRRMQIVFQDPYAALDPRMRVEEIVGEPLAIHGDQHGDGHRDEHRDGRNGASGRTRSSRRSLVVETLRAVGLDESTLPRYPHEFSGGQRQRINLARALVLRPELLVLDEPVSALDVSVSAQIVQLLRQLQRDFGLTYMFITHSMPLVRYMADDILVMSRGRVMEYGGWRQVCEQPQSDYTRALLSATPELPGVGPLPQARS